MTIPGWWPRRRQKAHGEDLVRSLYAEHGKSLLAYATRLTNDRAAAEDIVQETLLRAWKHADALKSGQGSVRGWLLTVARNIVTDRYRAKAARAAEVGEQDQQAPAQRDHAEDVVNSMVVLDAIERLSQEHRDVLVQLYYRGHTVGETAAVLGVPPGTVKSRSYYALRALRADMSETGAGVGR
ncbi:MAG TPA: sigma-70 family RNA polymerase sigma factor [Pseudonocardiaceae bacterium]|nr:sigma-70 family RNA polymerase sigma factor [Pseudonocardiaceae bacterium]